MEDYSRSRSYRDGRNMHIEVYRGGGGPSHNELRSYSTSSSSYTSSSVYSNSNYGYNQQAPREMKLKKAKSSSGGLFSDPELQRKKRVASYKVYDVEGKVKGSFRKSFRWLKDRYTQVVYGW